MDTGVPTVAARLTWDHGFPHPDWRSLSAMIEPSLPPETFHWVTTQMEAEWMLLLRNHLGGDYQVHEGPRTLLLTDLPRHEARETLDFIEQTLLTLTHALMGHADQATSGMHIVIVMSEEDDYYSYIAHFFSERLFRLTSGVCVRSGGEVHVVVNGAGPALRRTLAQQLGYDLLSQQRMPIWIEEGLVHVLTSYVLKEGEPKFDETGLAAQRQLWTSLGMDLFWGGAAFYQTDDTTQKAYELAELLVRTMNRIDAQAFDRFVGAAHPLDAGEPACRGLFGVSLRHIVREVLGEGPWAAPPWNGDAGTLSYGPSDDQ